MDKPDVIKLLRSLLDFGGHSTGIVHTSPEPERSESDTKIEFKGSI